MKGGCDDGDWSREAASTMRSPLYVCMYVSCESCSSASASSTAVYQCSVLAPSRTPCSYPGLLLLLLLLNQ